MRAVVAGSQARAEAHRAADYELTPSTYVKLDGQNGDSSSGPLKHPSRPPGGSIYIASRLEPLVEGQRANSQGAPTLHAPSPE